MSAEDDTRASALKRIAAMVRTRSFPYKLDVAAADEIKSLGPPDKSE